MVKKRRHTAAYMFRVTLGALEGSKAKLKQQVIIN